MKFLGSTEHEARVGPVRSGGETLGGLPAPLGDERLDDDGRQEDLPRLAGLRVRPNEADSPPPHELPADPQPRRVGVETHVFPPETEHLTAPKPEPERDNDAAGQPLHRNRTPATTWRGTVKLLVCRPHQRLGLDGGEGATRT